MVKYLLPYRKQLMIIKAIFMSKYKKLILSFIIIFCLGYWCVEKMITANISKASIAQKLEAVTGYHVVITGELHWHYSLHPSLTLEKITFTSEKSDIIILKNADIRLHLLSLLQKLFDVDFNFDDWQQNQLHFSKGTAHIEFKNNQLDITHFQSQFYQGNLEGSARVDLTQENPKFDITAGVNQIEIDNLLSDIAQSASISGKMNATTHLISQGKNAEQFINNINGDLLIHVNNGKLNTIHLGNVIPDLRFKNADFFDDLNINAPIKNGIANISLVLSAKNYHADGKGQINFNNQNLNMILNAYYTRSEQTKNIAIPINISGAIASPNVSVDLGKPLSELLKENGVKLKNNINLLIQGL